jgi:hypothetical protein
MEDSEETSQSLQIDLGPLQSDQQTTSSQDGQGKGDDVIVIDSDDEDDDEENDGEHEVSLVSISLPSASLPELGLKASALCTLALSSGSSDLLPVCCFQPLCFKSLVFLIYQVVDSHSQSVLLDYQVLLYRLVQECRIVY